VSDPEDKDDALEYEPYSRMGTVVAVERWSGMLYGCPPPTARACKCSHCGVDYNPLPWPAPKLCPACGMPAAKPLHPEKEAQDEQ